MKLTILVDNTTRIDRYLLGEPALSFYFEDDNKSYIFDLGYSDIFLKNAQKLQIDINNIDFIIFSHGHNDHTGGLFHLKNYYRELKELNIKFKKPKITAHQDVFTPKTENGYGNIGTPVLLSELNDFFDINITNSYFKLSEKLFYLGEIPKNKNLECMDDSALAYVSAKGLIIITGCSHSGIENIIEHAKNITGINKIYTVIGGIHTIDKSDKEIEDLGQFFLKEKIKTIYPCHCSGLKSKIILSKYINIEDVCTGDIIEF